MVSRIELVLAAGLLFFLFLASQSDKESEKERERAAMSARNTEMTDVSFREVNRTTLLNDMHARRAQRYKTIWYFDDFTLRSPEVKLLKAKKALRDDKVFKMSGNVTMKKRDGTFYRAESIRYDIKKRILYSIGRFEEYKKKNVFIGNDFVNDMSSKTVEAYDVFVTYGMKDNPASSE